MHSLQPCTQLLFWCLLGFSSSLLAQQPTDSIPISIVKNTDGNQFIGKITSQDSAFITLATENLGVMKLPKKFIKTIKPLKSSQIVGGEYWAENLHTTRYYFAPNGYGLKKREGYYQNTWIFLNQAGIGLTNYFSIGVGALPLSLLGSDITPLWVMPKVSIPIKKDKLNIGVGAFIGGVIREEPNYPQSSLGFELLYSNITVGPRHRNATFGLAYGYSGGKWTNAILNMSFMWRLNKRFLLISENYMFVNGTIPPILSGGFRFLAKKVAIDICGFNVLGYEELGDLILSPWVSIHVPFDLNTKTPNMP